MKRETIVMSYWSDCFLLYRGGTDVSWRRLDARKEKNDLQAVFPWRENGKLHVDVSCIKSPTDPKLHLTFIVDHVDIAKCSSAP